jgi:peptidoglycan/LPS O-acetylase OafA/YrhL
MDNGPGGERHLYDWPTSVAVALGGTAAAVVLIVVFTYLVDYTGSFWSQVIYFAAILTAVVGLALRSRRNDDADPSRLRSAASPVSPLGLPGPFVATQALGILGLAMIVVGLVVRGDRGILWVFAGLVLVLVGAVGLVMWLGTLAGGRRPRPTR